MHKFHTFEHRLGNHPRPGEAREKQKKYGANAPQLHPIRCYIDFYVMLCNEQGKNKKVRRKRATFAPYLPACSLISPSTHPTLLAHNGVGGRAVVV
jgi:hypothetical protein